MSKTKYEIEYFRYFVSLHALENEIYSIRSESYTLLRNKNFLSAKFFELKTSAGNGLFGKKILFFILNVGEFVLVTIPLNFEHYSDQWKNFQSQLCAWSADWRQCLKAEGLKAFNIDMRVLFKRKVIQNYSILLKNESLIC